MNLLKKALLVFLLCLINIYYLQAESISSFSYKVKENYNQKEIFTKIFVYGTFTPVQIKKLEAIGFSYSDILVLSSVFMYIDDDFDAFLLKIKKKSTAAIIDLYNVDETAVLKTAKEILNIRITEDDISEYENYGRLLYYSLSSGGEIQQQFYNWEYSYFISAGVSMVPADFLSLDLNYKISSFPVENTNSDYVFNIKNSFISGYLTLTPADNFDLSIYGSYGTGDYRYKYSMYSVYGELNKNTFILEGEIKKSKEEYLNDIVTNSFQTFDSVNYLAGILFLLKNNSSIEIQITYILNKESDNNIDLSLNYYKNSEYINFAVYYDYIKISDSTSSHTINPDFTVKINSLLDINLGLTLNIYNVTTTQEVVSTTYSKNSSFTTSQLVKVTDSTINYSIYSGIDINF